MNFSKYGRFWVMLAALVVGFGAFAEDPPDPTGMWDIEVDMGGSPMAASLEVTKNDDGTFSGTLNSPMGELTLENVTYTPGESLGFQETVGEGDAAMEFKFDGTFSDADHFEGVLESAMGPMPVKGTRAGEEASPIAGIWNVVSDSQLGTLERDLVVYRNSSAKYNSEDASFDVTDLAVDGNAVTFDVTVDAQGQDLALSFVGTYEGDSLNGEFMMDGSSVAEVTGTKSDAGGIASAVGDWAMEAETPLGQLIAKLSLRDGDDSKLITDEGESPIVGLDVDADFMTFETLVIFEGGEYDVVFEGTLDGDSVVGDFLMDGSPVASLIATRGASE